MKLTKCKMSVTSGVLIISLLSLIILFVGQLSAQDKETPSPSAASKLAKDLIGTWILVGTPDEVGEPPTAGGRLRFFTGDKKGSSCYSYNGLFRNELRNYESQMLGGECIIIVST